MNEIRKEGKKKEFSYWKSISRYKWSYFVRRLGHEEKESDWNILCSTHEAKEGTSLRSQSIKRHKLYFNQKPFLKKLRSVGVALDNGNQTEPTWSTWLISLFISQYLPFHFSEMNKLHNSPQLDVLRLTGTDASLGRKEPLLFFLSLWKDHRSRSTNIPSQDVGKTSGEWQMQRRAGATQPGEAFPAGRQGCLFWLLPEIAH